MRSSRRHAASWEAGAVSEALESRLLLTATIVQPVPSQVVAQDTRPTIDLSNSVVDPSLPDTVVEFNTNLGAIDVEVFDTDVPATVANFLNYVNSKAYDGTIIHRVINDTTTPPPFQIAQGGGFFADGSAITTNAPVVNEFHFPNQRGTIAMAKVAGDPNSATSQWFFNDSDNPGLDDPSNNGGYTVFGRVIFGMNVVDEITGLPTIDASSTNPAFTNLPLIENGSTSTLVVMNSVSVLPKITYNADSDNLEVVNPTINGNQLTLNPGPGVSGIAHVTLTGTDLNGHTVTQVFRVEVMPSAQRALDVTIGGKQPHSVSYVDPDGSRGVITLGGKGSAVVHFAGDNLSVSHSGGLHVSGQHVLVMGIDATGTNSGTSLKTTGSFGIDHLITVGRITTDGGFGSIKLIRTVLEGDFTSPQGARTLEINYARSGTITLGPATSSHVQVKLIGLNWQDENFLSQEPVSTLRSTSWNNGDNVSEVFQAPFVRLIHLTSNFTPGLQLSGAGAPHNDPIGRFIVTGFIGGTWNFPASVTSLKVGGTSADFNGTFTTPVARFETRSTFSGTLTAPSIQNLIVLGSMSEAKLNLTAPLNPNAKALNNLTVRGAIDTSTVTVTGNIGSIKATDMLNSSVFAGIGSLTAGVTLPQSAGDFTSTASISSITLHPRKGVTGFVNSNIAAVSLGTLVLNSIGFANTLTPFGIATLDLKDLQGSNSANKKKFRLRNVTSQAIAAAQLQQQGITSTGDFEVVIVPIQQEHGVSFL